MTHTDYFANQKTGFIAYKSAVMLWKCMEQRHWPEHSPLLQLQTIGTALGGLLQKAGITTPAMALDRVLLVAALSSQFLGRFGRKSAFGQNLKHKQRDIPDYSWRWMRANALAADSFADECRLFAFALRHYTFLCVGNFSGNVCLRPGAAFDARMIMLTALSRAHSACEASSKPT